MTEQASQRQQSVVRMSLWAVCAQLSITVLGAVSSIILNRAMGPEGRGVIGLVLLWPPLLAALTSAGWLSTLGNSMSRRPDLCRAYWMAGQLTGLAVAGMTCTLGWWAIPVLMRDWPQLWEMARCYLLVIPLIFLSQPPVAGLDALQRFDFSSRIRIGNLIGMLCFLVPLAALGALTPQWYCAAHLITIALATAYSIWLFAQASSGSWRPQWGPMPAYVVRAAPLGWVQVLHLRVDQMVIALLAPIDPMQFGAYIAGATLAGMVSPIAEGLALVLLPASARRTETDAFKLFTRMGRLFVLGAVLMALPVALAAPWILTFVYGKQFAMGAYALRIGLLTVVLAGLYNMALTTILGVGRPGMAAITGIMSALFSVMGSILLLPQLGYLGAALGQALGLLAGFSMMMAVYWRKGFTVMALLPWKSDVVLLWHAMMHALRRKPAALERVLATPAGDFLIVRGGK